MYNHTILININREVIEIPVDECFMCGSNVCITKHYVIPKEYAPMRNVAMPLCEKHKDATHYFYKRAVTLKNV